jgi:aspartyl-tRNA(Asn)/glutamyl-tRNA(Gln) amidotransferase subunit A
MDHSKIIEKCKKLNEKYGCFITINESFPEERPELLVSVKDNICTAGLRTTAGSKILEKYVPVFDATVISRLKSQGAAVIGKTAMDEFGFGSWSTNCAFTVPKNPFDISRTCGGSSGGAACLTQVADFDHVAIAESTGGSISNPAAFCGVWSITPTYGLISRYGLIDYANSLDKIGVMAKKVKDLRRVFEMVVGRDPRDQTTMDYSPSKPEVKTIGIPKQYLQGLDKQVEKEFWSAVKRLEREGLKFQEFDIQYVNEALAAYYVIAMAEASTNLARYSGLRYGLQFPSEDNFQGYASKVRELGFGQEAKRRIVLGTYVRMAGYRDQYYLKALKVRSLVINEFKRHFKKFDAIAAPTMPMLPLKFSEISELSPIENYQMDMLTVGPNLAGLPHLNIPVKEKTPIGLHIIGDHMAEPKLFKVSELYES